MKPPRKLHIKSYGCQMNVYDAQRMVDTLAPEGYVETASADEADLVILNTCHIREKASEKVYSELGGCAWPRTRRRATAATCDRGRRLCRAGRRRGDLRRAPVGRRRGRPAELSSSASIAGARAARGRALETEFPVEDKFGFLAAAEAGRDPRARHLRLRHRAGRLRQVLHLLRGALYARRRSSRPVARIIDDVKRLADNGVREITLIGQNVNAYHGEGPDGRIWPLGRLLHVSPKSPASCGCAIRPAIPATSRTRLIEAHRDLPALMPFVHLPVQSGSDRILSAMNRKHTAVITAGSSTVFAMPAKNCIFIGFYRRLPRRTEEDFSATLALVTQIGYAAAYSFKNSPRPGTPAAEMQETVSATDMDERLARLQESIDSQQWASTRRRLAARLSAVRTRRPAIPARSSAARPICSPHM